MRGDAFSNEHTRSGAFTDGPANYRHCYWHGGYDVRRTCYWHCCLETPYNSKHGTSLSSHLSTHALQMTELFRRREISNWQSFHQPHAPSPIWIFRFLDFWMFIGISHGTPCTSPPAWRTANSSCPRPHPPSSWPHQPAPSPCREADRPIAYNRPDPCCAY